MKNINKISLLACASLFMSNVFAAGPTLAQLTEAGKKAVSGVGKLAKETPGKVLTFTQSLNEFKAYQKQAKDLFNKDKKKNIVPILELLSKAIIQLAVLTKTTGESLELINNATVDPLATALGNKTVGPKINDMIKGVKESSDKGKEVGEMLQSIVGLVQLMKEMEAMEAMEAQ